MNATSLANPNTVQKLIGRELDVTLADGRRFFGRLLNYDPDVASVTLSLENNGVLTTHSFPISMARNVQTR